MSTKVLGAEPKPSDIPTVQGVMPDTKALHNNMDKIYAVEKLNWYSAKPYGFKMQTRERTSFTMFLPISPSNLTVSTQFATNLIPTLYGTVEEHSDVRYYDITIEGTTGMAPKFVEPGAGDNANALYAMLKNEGRSKGPEASIGLGGFFPKTLAALTKLQNKASDLITGGPSAKTGVYADNSGYVAFHNLYRFLLQYKKDAALGAGRRKDHPLTFFNYKDNNQYNVVVRGFSMRRSADNPMLYSYSIQLRGYKLSSISKKIDDDFAQRIKDLGLNGINSSSLLGSIKSISSQAKGVIGSLAGGINVLGR